ncbi:UNVERIFIED_CONTAM: hypothetical protein HDU68_001892 [Siphonaria sp. JEL0065]|nr:hypothetical protein HDU68_001892 [Siphonaria sp. JEL0065]
MQSLQTTATAAAAEGDTEVLMDLLGLKRSSTSESLASPADRQVAVNTLPSPLLAAASKGHLDAVVILVDRAGALVDLADSDGETALLKASFQGHFPVVCFLLSRGTYSDHRDKDGWSALHNAASGGFKDVSELLLEKDNVVDKVSKSGFTPLS